MLLTICLSKHHQLHCVKKLFPGPLPLIAALSLLPPPATDDGGSKQNRINNEYIFCTGEIPHAAVANRILYIIGYKKQPIAR